MNQPTPSVIEPRVRHTVASALGVADDQITADAAFGSIPQWDSMGHMNVVLAVEQAFGLTFESYEIADLTSVASIVAALTERGVAS